MSSAFAPFNPVPMAVGVLTAALQDLTSRSVRDTDPDQAIEDWVEYAGGLGVDCIELSAALPPRLSDVPAEALLDPVADHLNLEEPLTPTRVSRINAALRAAGVTLADIGYFDNMLIDDPTARQMKHQYMIRAMDAATALGVPAVCGFVGRNPSLDMDQNLGLFDKYFIPLLKQAKSRGLVYRVEQCPMPGWNTTDAWHNNIAYSPEMWVLLHQRAEKAGVGDQFRVHYDPSHAILMGQDSRSIFQYLRDGGYAFLIDGFHVKGQVVNAEGVTAWGYGGQTCNRGDRENGQPHPDPKRQGGAWLKQTILCEHELPGTAKHDPLGYLQNRTVDWYDLLIAAREILEIDCTKVPLIVEHEYGPARVQDPDKLKPILQGSIAFTRAMDQAAAAQWALWQSMKSQEILIQGYGRTAFRS